jgi:hypothetical protein
MCQEVNEMNESYIRFTTHTTLTVALNECAALWVMELHNIRGALERLLRIIFGSRVEK